MVLMIPSMITPSSATVEESLPVFLKGGDIAVVLIHGYNGHPGDLSEIALRLHQQGFTVAVPRLPGHGTNAEDFLQTDEKDWLRRAVDVCLDLCASYQTIYLVGISMGALIALYLASQMKVKRLVLISPALHLKNPVHHILPALSLFIRKIARNSTMENIDSGGRKILYENYWSWHYPPMIMKIKRISRLTLKKLKQVEAETLIIAAKRDELVTLRGAEEIYYKIASKKKELTILENSPHFCLGGQEKDKVISLACEWLLRHNDSFRAHN